MIYTFDASSFNVIGHYFPERFPSFWKSFNNLAINNRIISVREVYYELEKKLPENKQHLHDWTASYKYIFIPPGDEETKFVSQIFSIPHFQQLVKPKQTFVSTPLADPFVIASAMINKGCVVTEEGKKDHSARIPNVCEHFGIDCINVERFMEREQMQF